MDFVTFGLHDESSRTTSKMQASRISFFQDGYLYAVEIREREPATGLCSATFLLFG
jgi:hypothetical protein